MGSNLKDRIGVDIGRRAKLEDGLAWAAKNNVYYIDIQLDSGENTMETFDDARCEAVKDLCRANGIHLGLHTLSGVNMAEYSNFFRQAADQYLRAYIDMAKRLDAEWIVVHAGFHFTADYEQRKQAGLERLQRASEYAEEQGVHLLLENMNREPKDAEVNYLGSTLEECRYFFDNLKSPNINWTFTINHATLVPEGIDGFIDAFGIERMREVRVADNLGDKEHHMYPGDGSIDFRSVFTRIESMGYTGHYTNGFGTLDDMLSGRDYLVAEAKAAGVPSA
ncbi:MAG: TIM barrel protein [Rhodospirillales bacterium]|nr:TIM barrel protein [Rhodospirillales bacterium]